MPLYFALETNNINTIKRNVKIFIDVIQKDHLYIVKLKKNMDGQKFCNLLCPHDNNVVVYTVLPSDRKYFNQHSKKAKVKPSKKSYRCAGNKNAEDAKKFFEKLLRKAQKK